MTILALTLLAAAAGPPPKAVPTPVIETVTLAPIYHLPFACMEHPEGQLAYVGDALGTDCFVEGMDEGAAGTGFFDTHRGDGRRNEDWHGWQAALFAPIAGTVQSITVNPVTNVPGTMGRPPASQITIRALDGTVVVLAHLGSFAVKEGDTVVAGQPIGRVGNNGTARAPHIHVGAYRGLTPLQIRWDLKAEGKIPALVGN